MNRATLFAALAAMVSASVVVGCSGGIDSSLVATIAADALGPDHVHGVAMPSRYSSDHSVTEVDGGLNMGWTGQTNIEAIFEANCSQCHSTGWSSCWTVQANVDSIQAMVSSGAMPRSGALTASDKSTLLTWLGEGANCTGPREPPSNQGIGGGEEGAPTATAPGVAAATP